MHKIFKVFSFEFHKTLSRKSFLLSLILVPLIPALIFAVLKQVQKKSDAPDLTQIIQSEISSPGLIGLVDESGLIQHDSLLFTDGRFARVSSERRARELTADGILKGYYLIPADYLQNHKIVYVQKKFQLIPDEGSSELIKQLINYNLMDGNDELYQRYTNPIRFSFEALHAEQTQSLPQNEWVSIMAPLLLAMFFYTTLITSSVMMLNAIGQDKENRVMEMLLSSAKPLELFIGKLLALGLASLIQLGVWLSTMAFSMRAAGGLFSILESLKFPPNLIPFGLLYFLLGFFLYGSLMAGIGAMAPNLREANQYTMIVTLPLIFTVVVINNIVTYPSGTLSTILSFIPFSAPVVMMVRLFISSVPVWQGVLSLGLLLATVILVVRGVAKLFSSQTLISGQKFSIKSFFRTFLIGR